MNQRTSLAAAGLVLSVSCALTGCGLTGDTAPKQGLHREDPVVENLCGGYEGKFYAQCGSYQPPEIPDSTFGSAG